MTGSFILVNWNTACGQCVIKSYWPVYWQHVSIYRPLWEDICNPSKISKQHCPKHQVAPSCGWWHTYQVYFHDLELFFLNMVFLPLFQLGHIVSIFKCHAFIFLIVWLTFIHTFSNWFCLTAIKQRFAQWKRNNLEWSHFEKMSSRDITILSNILKAQDIKSSPAGFSLSVRLPLHVEASGRVKSAWGRERAVISASKWTVSYMCVSGYEHRYACTMMMSVWWAWSVLFFQPPQAASLAELLRPLWTSVSRGEVRLRPEPRWLQLHHRGWRVSFRAQMLRE